MVPALLITLREGLEAALIIGIILAYLTHGGYRDRHGSVWLGTGLAVLVSVIAGGIIFFTVGALEGKAEQIFEGVAMLVAVAMLSYMVIWMRQQSANIKGNLQAQVKGALHSQSSIALVAMAFAVVVREGIETVLFLFAATRTAAAWESTIGGLAGLGIAIVVGLAIYAGGRRINLRTFFNVTGVLLVFVAAGLLAYAVHELEEAGILPTIIEHVWDTSSILNKKEGIGAFLRALFGYNSNPSLSEVIAYVLFLAAGLWHFRYGGKAAGMVARGDARRELSRQGQEA